MIFFIKVVSLKKTILIINPGSPSSFTNIYILVNGEGLPGIIIISNITRGHDWEDFSSLLNKPSFRHKAQYGHYEGTKYTLINSTNEL